MRAISFLFFSLLTGSLLVQQADFVILDVERRANEVVLTLSGDEEGKTYRVEYSKDLSDASWAVREADRVALDGGRVQLTTTVAEDAVDSFEFKACLGRVLQQTL